MSIIEPVQEVTRQLDHAFEALEADPRSKDKERYYEQLRVKRKALILEAKAKISF